MKRERIRKDFLSAKEDASAGDRKGKLSNIVDEGDGAIEAAMKAELQRGANSETLNFQEKFPSISFFHQANKTHVPGGER